MNKILYTVLRIRVEETNENMKIKKLSLLDIFQKSMNKKHYIFYGEMKDHPKVWTAISSYPFPKRYSANKARGCQLFIK